jgi:hypothetical protein
MGGGFLFIPLTLLKCLLYIIISKKEKFAWKLTLPPKKARNFYS